MHPFYKFSVQLWNICDLNVPVRTLQGVCALDIVFSARRTCLEAEAVTSPLSQSTVFTCLATFSYSRCAERIHLPGVPVPVALDP